MAGAVSKKCAIIHSNGIGSTRYIGVDLDKLTLSVKRVARLRLIQSYHWIMDCILSTGSVNASYNGLWMQYKYWTNAFCIGL